MRVSFGATVDEIADAHLRLFFDTAVARRDRTVASLATAGLIAAPGFFLLSGVTPLLAAPFAIAAAVATFFLFRREYERIVRRKTRKVIVEQLGDEGPVPVSVSLAPEGLIVEQHGTTARFDWERVARMVDRPAGIEFHATHPAALMVVRARAFPSTAERAAFVRLARQYLASAGR